MAKKKRNVFEFDDDEQEPIEVGESLTPFELRDLILEERPALKRQLHIHQIGNGERYCQLNGVYLWSMEDWLRLEHELTAR